MMRHPVGPRRVGTGVFRARKEGRITSNIRLQCSRTSAAARPGPSCTAAFRPIVNLRTEQTRCVETLFCRRADPPLLYVLTGGTAQRRPTLSPTRPCSARPRAHERASPFRRLVAGLPRLGVADG